GRLRMAQHPRKTLHLLPPPPLPLHLLLYNPWTLLLLHPVPHHPLPPPPRLRVLHPLQQAS
ncbi:hypothetical protein M9458_030761, partial [Cirrhinus mrigala]